MKKPHAILLVEDNPADVAITRRALEESGLAVELIVVRDGAEAVERLLRRGRHADSPSWRHPDLILLDINLPTMSGREFLEIVRASPGLHTIPVVALSTSRRAEDVEGMYAAGANTYLEKPPDFARFVEALRTLHRYWFDLALLPPARE